MAELSTTNLLLKLPYAEEPEVFARVMQRIYDHFHTQAEDIETLKTDLQALPGAALLTGKVAERENAGLGLLSVHDFIEECGKDKPEEVRQLHATLDHAIVSYRESLLGNDTEDKHFMR